jgi:hypothetical protein
MKTCFDAKEIASIRFKDGALYDTLTVIYKNGRKETIRKALDVNWELYSIYTDLKKKMNKQ